MACLHEKADPIQATAPADPGPRLPVELLDHILGALGRSSDRNTLATCFLVSKCFHTLAQKHYFRILTIIDKHFVDTHGPLLPWEYHTMQLLFHNPCLFPVGLIQELEVHHYRDSTHDLKTCRYPVAVGESLWDDPVAEAWNYMLLLPLYLRLRQSLIHTARFGHRSSVTGVTWFTTNTKQLSDICRIPTLKRVYFTRVSPSVVFSLDGHSPLAPGLERLELLWVADSEDEFDESIPTTPTIEQPPIHASATSTKTSHFPLYQVIRMSWHHVCAYMWLRPQRFFESWFPDYTPTPALQAIFQIGWTAKTIFDFPEVCDALDHMPQGVS